MLLYAIVRFRRGMPATTSEPPQVYGSKPIEIAWTAAPALIVFILVLVTTRTLWEVNVAPPPRRRPGDQPLFVTVIGRQWWWEYRYDHYNGKQARLHHGQRAAHPGQRDGRRPDPVYLDLEVGGRVPQLLGARGWRARPT